MSNKPCPHVFAHAHSKMLVGCSRMRNHPGRSGDGVVFHESREVSGFMVTWRDGSAHDYPTMLATKGIW